MRILVIDPESSGLDLVSELLRRGADVIPWKQAEPFQLIAPWDASVPDRELVSLAERGRFDAVIAGGESGVSAAEWLASHMGLPSSDPAFIHHRRDKNSMIQRVAECGVATGASHLVRSLGDLEQVLGLMTPPIMLKPSNSAGSDMCRAVDNAGDARAFCREILSGRSIMGNVNAGAVVQEFLVGPQFHVNTVVVDGRHRVTEVYSNRFRTPNGRPQLYAGRTHLPSEPGMQDVIDYTLSVLEALGVTAGATHSEVRITERGPLLIEFNGRLMGPSQPTDYFTSAQGFSQASIYADALVGNTGHAERLLSSDGQRDYLGFYLLTARSSGLVSRFSDVALRSLPSYRCVAKAPQRGDAVTVDNRTTDADLGILFFAAESVDQLENDLSSTARLEAEGLIHEVTPTISADSGAGS